MTNHKITEGMVVEITKGDTTQYMEVVSINNDFLVGYRVRKDTMGRARQAYPTRRTFRSTATRLVLTNSHLSNVIKIIR